MAGMRKPFQGVWNIIRFNWHFYALAFALLISGLILGTQINPTIGFYINLLCLFAAILIGVSLLVSFYVYDLSNLYEFDWLDGLDLQNGGNAHKYHRGF